MKIFVLVKEVPDTYGDRKLNLETGLADRAAGMWSSMRSPSALSKSHSATPTRTTAPRWWPSRWLRRARRPPLRRALAIGAGSAVHIADEQLAGADLGLTAEVLAAAIRRGAPTS